MSVDGRSDLRRSELPRGPLTASPHRGTSAASSLRRAKRRSNPEPGRRTGLLRFARNDDMEHHSRGAHAPEACSKGFFHSRRSRKRRGGTTRGKAERREAHPAMAASCDTARACEARSPFGAPLRRLPERANAPAQPRPRFTRTRGCGRYPHRHSRLSKAPCAPVVMPAGHSSLGANCVHCL